MSKTGVVCDKNLYKNSSYVAEVVDSFIRASNSHLILYDYQFEPSYQYLDNLMDELNKLNLTETLTGWLGIGGGSAMDTAKGLAILSRNSGPSINYRGFPEKINEPLPVIAVPSTTGTGSEVVYNASFIDEKGKVKLGINHRNNFPVLAILDPLIVSTAPLSVLASSGCDALVHSLESFVSVKSNPHTRLFSTMAFKLLMKNMPILLEKKGNLDNWAEMQWAAVYAMYALSNTSSGPTGAFSYHLGTNFKVPHGIAGGVFIGKQTNFNYRFGFKDYSELYGWDENQNLSLSVEQKCSEVIKSINNLLDLAKIPKRLRDLGVSVSDFQGFVDFYKNTKTVFDFNPVLVEEEHLTLLLEV